MFETMRTATGHDGRRIFVGDHVRHHNHPNGKVWKVVGFRDCEVNGPSSLWLVDPDVPNRQMFMYHDHAVLADGRT